MPYKEYKEGDIIRTPEGKWLNSDVFRQEAIKFMTTGRYCDEPVDSPAYFEYWDEQLRRCREGYEVAGEKITGYHYSYLNFSEIELTKDDNSDPNSNVANKETRCPDFWDGDYDYYWCVEIARNGVTTKNALLASLEDKQRINALPPDEAKEERVKLVEKLRMRVKLHPNFLNGGHHMIVGKARRKGYSYKNADICKTVFNTIPKSRTVIGAFDKKYLFPDGTAGKVSSYLSFINKNTAWGKAREKVDKQEHKRASFEEEINGVTIESGYMSEIIAVTFKDNPSAGRGKDIKIELFEEAGEFPNLKASYNASRQSAEDGKYVTGQFFVFGTGGDMGGGTVDFADMFYHPIEHNFMPFENIWDKDAEGTYCGFFHPCYLNLVGFCDDQGNSDVEGAIAYENAKRNELIANSSSSVSIQSRMQELPMCPAEAFLIVSTNDFPVVELRNQYNKVVREKIHIKMGQPVFLEDITPKKEDEDNHKVIVDENGELKPSMIYKPKVRARPDLNNQLEPIWDYKLKTKNRTGAVVIYEYPVTNPPKGLYKIGFDPYRQVDGASLAAIYVYKTVRRGDYTRNIIVAQYVGRPYSPAEVNRICVQLCELYNAEVMHENEVTHVIDYFEKKKKLHLLAAQPDAVISAAVKRSTVARVYGIHMIDKLKDAGEKYIKEWLLEIRDYDENGNALRNIDYIYDPGLLEELINYNRKGNFDRVMAFMMVMFQVAEDDENKVHEAKEISSNAEDLLALMRKQFSNPTRLN